MLREETPLVYRILFDGRARNQVTSTVIRGAPVLQEVFPVRNEHGEVIGALRSEMLLIEHERQRKRHARFRRAVARAREQIVAGQMRGGERLGRLGVHDGIMVIDSESRIEYSSRPPSTSIGAWATPTTWSRRRWSSSKPTSTSASRRWSAACASSSVSQEQDLVWIKRVVPLTTRESTGWPGKIDPILVACLGGQREQAAVAERARAVFRPLWHSATMRSAAMSRAAASSICRSSSNSSSASAGCSAMITPTRGNSGAGPKNGMTPGRRSGAPWVNRCAAAAPSAVPSSPDA